jgi:uncharacterized glyoxalase superfamily protein PhnB
MTTTAPNSPGTWPCLSYRDAPGAISFLTDTLGFTLAARHDGESPDDVEHCELRWPEGGGVMLGSVRPGGMATAPGTAVVYVQTADPDGIRARAAERGAEVTPPADKPYGSREFAARDPEGNRWQFGTYAGQPLA